MPVRGRDRALDNALGVCPYGRVSPARLGSLSVIGRRWAVDTVRSLCGIELAPMKRPQSWLGEAVWGGVIHFGGE